MEILNGPLRAAAPIAQGSLAIAPDGRVRLALRHPWRDGRRALLCDPLDFFGRLAALTPRPRVDLLLYHGVFGPHAGAPASPAHARDVAGGAAEVCPVSCTPGEISSAELERAVRVLLEQPDLGRVLVAAEQRAVVGVARWAGSLARRASPATIPPSVCTSAWASTVTAGRAGRDAWAAIAPPEQAGRSALARRAAACAAASSSGR